MIKGVVWSKTLRGYVEVDSLGEALILPEQNRTKIDRESARVKHANFSCFEKIKFAASTRRSRWLTRFAWLFKSAKVGQK